MTPTEFLIIYSILWLISIILYRKLIGGTKLGLGLMLLWFFSSCVSIWMIQQVNYYHSNLYVYDIKSIVPLVYLWITVLMYASPILLFRCPSNSYLLFYAKSTGNGKKIFTDTVVLFFILFSIGKLYCLLKIPNALDFYAADAGSMMKKEHMSDVNDDVFSTGLGVYSSKLTNIFRDSMLCFAFYYTIVKENKKAIALFLCCVVLPFYEALVLGNRQKIVCLLMTLFITYQLFQPFFENVFKKKIQFFILVFITVAAVPLLLISVLRFGDYYQILIYEILRYFGESCVNFSSWLFPHLQGQDNGKQIMSSLFKNLSFYHHVETIGPWFYTFIGNLVMAWGRFLTFIGGVLFLVLSIINKESLQSRKMSVGKAILLQTIAIMCYEGLFGFIHYLYFGGFVIGFLWILILDSNWFDFVGFIIQKTACFFANAFQMLKKRFYVDK